MFKGWIKSQHKIAVTKKTVSMAHFYPALLAWGSIAFLSGIVKIIMVAAAEFPQSLIILIPQWDS